LFTALVEHNAETSCRDLSHFPPPQLKSSEILLSSFEPLYQSSYSPLTQWNSHRLFRELLPLRDNESQQLFFAPLFLPHSLNLFTVAPSRLFRNSGEIEVQLPPFDGIATIPPLVGGSLFPVAWIGPFARAILPLICLLHPRLLHPYGPLVAVIAASSFSSHTPGVGSPCLGDVYLPLLSASPLPAL